MVRMYTGTREAGKVTVTVNGIPLDPRWELRSHSPSGFEFGFLGSGPSQLALAILADHVEALGLPMDIALENYMTFKDEVISQLHDDAWKMGSADIASWLLTRLRDRPEMPKM